jgi:hypothetical protein
VVSWLRRNPAKEFLRAFGRNLAACHWEPHPRYSVFTQYDGDLYLAQREAFLHKYRCFHSVARTIAPAALIELGVCAGSGADAYLSGSPEASYLGIDTFGEPFHDGDGSPWRRLMVDESSLWKPYDIASALLRDRGFADAELMVANLRHLSTLPRHAGLVVVDAAHDYANQYADLQLALTAEPAFIFVDDVDGEETARAVKQFLDVDLTGRDYFTARIDYIEGGLVIGLS